MLAAADVSNSMKVDDAGDRSSRTGYAFSQDADDTDAATPSGDASCSVNSAGSAGPRLISAQTQLDPSFERQIWHEIHSHIRDRRSARKSTARP